MLNTAAKTQNAWFLFDDPPRGALVMLRPDPQPASELDIMRVVPLVMIQIEKRTKTQTHSLGKHTSTGAQ